MVVQNVVHVVRKRLRASDDEQIATLGETLTDEQIARLTAWSADGTLQDIGNTVRQAICKAH